jgi:bidirectional [NiFe] hydrogenase diaphorase subunit
MREQAKSPGAATDVYPGGDERFEILDATMKRHRHQPDALIEVLHTAQEIFGHLDLDLLLYVARGLKLPPSRVYGVATFYHLFTFTPKGEHTCVVCLGTACYVLGADALLATVERAVGVLPGRTTPDGRISLDTARCIGTCGLAPLVVFDGAVCRNQTPESVRRHLGGWGEHGSPD